MDLQYYIILGCPAALFIRKKQTTQHCHKQNKTSQTIIDNLKQNKPSSDQQNRDVSKIKHYNTSLTKLSSEPNKEKMNKVNKTGKTILHQQNNISDSFLTLSNPGASQQLTSPITNKQNTSIEPPNLALLPAKNIEVQSRAEDNTKSSHLWRSGVSGAEESQCGRN